MFNSSGARVIPKQNEVSDETGTYAGGEIFLVGDVYNTNELVLPFNSTVTPKQQYKVKKN